MGCQEKIRIRPPPCGTPPPAIVRQPPRRAPIKIRVAVNSGEVVVHSIRTGEAHTEYAPIEHTTNVAARLQAISRTSSIVVSENTHNLTEAYFPSYEPGGACGSKAIPRRSMSTRSAGSNRCAGVYSVRWVADSPGLSDTGRARLD